MFPRFCRLGDEAWMMHLSGLNEDPVQRGVGGSVVA
jgi:hypothetical protein